MIFLSIIHRQNCIFTQHFVLHRVKSCLQSSHYCPVDCLLTSSWGKSNSGPSPQRKVRVIRGQKYPPSLTCISLYLRQPPFPWKQAVYKVTVTSSSLVTQQLNHPSIPLPFLNKHRRKKSNQSFLNQTLLRLNQNMISIVHSYSCYHHSVLPKYLQII